MATTPFQRVAHRGASVERLENTLSAFKLAMDRGADAVELDVHLTRDGVVVVHHDEDVGGHPISDTNWADVAEARLKDDERVPRLEDVLKAVGDRLEVYIELKGVGVGEAAIDVARRRCSRFAVPSPGGRALGSGRFRGFGVLGIPKLRKVWRASRRFEGLVSWRHVSRFRLVGGGG